MSHQGGGNDHRRQLAQRAALVPGVAAFGYAPSAPEQVLAEKPHRGRPRGVCALSRRRLLAELAKDPLALGYAATNWTVPLLARHLQWRGLPITARTLRRRLHAAGLRWKRPRYVFAAPEPNLPQKKGLSRAA